MQHEVLRREGRQVILQTGGMICSTTRELASSRLFGQVVEWYVEDRRGRNSAVLGGLDVDFADHAEIERLVEVLRSLAIVPLEQVTRIVPGSEGYLDRRRELHRLVEDLYDFWRSFDRFLVAHSSQGPNAHDTRPYRTFNMTVEQLTHLVRALYRDICESITGEHPRVYRQVWAGCEVGLIAVDCEWPCPDTYGERLRGVPFIRQALLTPPLIFRTPTNTRTGQFLKTDVNPIDGIDLSPDEWLCFPARVGPVVVFVYFHHRFMSLGCSLANLFELATDEEVAAGPDALYLYGAPAEVLARFGDLPTVFHEDPASGLLVAAVPDEDRFAYFGYLKKMILTLHNVAIMRRGRMPFHGAMVRVQLRGGPAANILIIGDTATGKSECLEAFRAIGEAEISDLVVVADDMGSLEVDADGRLFGYGTEVGAFIRLDDLQHGYAFNQVDRAIVHNPHLVNARVILPVTTIEEILHGYPVDIILYANNYEEVDDSHPAIEPLSELGDALEVFREGAAMAKGTTTSTGLGHCYFANVFGPPQYRELHEGLAQKTFGAAYAAGIFVGQMRTRLGIPGYETTGPEQAARALLALVKQRLSA